MLARGATGSSSLSSTSEWVGVSGSSLLPPQARSDSAYGANKNRTAVSLHVAEQVHWDQPGVTYVHVRVCVCVCVCVLHLSLSPRGSSWRGHLSSVVQLPSSPPLNNTNIYEPGALIVPEIKKNMQGSPGQFANASSMLLFPEWFPNRRPVFMSHSLAAGFSFSFFFFLHFQGLKMRPRLASLLLRRTGGVRTPETRQPECSTLCWSITSRTQSKQSWSLK